MFESFSAQPAWLSRQSARPSTLWSWVRAPRWVHVFRYVLTTKTNTHTQCGNTQTYTQAFVSLIRLLHQCAFTEKCLGCAWPCPGRRSRNGQRLRDLEWEPILLHAMPPTHICEVFFLKSFSFIESVLLKVFQHSPPSSVGRAQGP